VLLFIRLLIHYSNNIVLRQNLRINFTKILNEDRDILDLIVLCPE